MRSVLCQLSEAVKASTARYPKVHFLDCFGVTDPYLWRDDMHPDTDGFKALAKKFAAKIR